MKKRILAALLVLSGCITEKGATGWMDKHPPVAASYCNRLFPVIPVKQTTTSTTTSGRPDTTYIPGPVMYVNCDSNTGIVQAPCPPTRVIHDTTTKEITTEREVESTAKLVILRDSAARMIQAERLLRETADKQLKNVQQVNDRLRGGRDNWRMIALLLIAYRALVFILKKWLPFLSLFP